MSEKERQEFTEKVLQEVFGELRFEILDSSARMNYIRYQLGQTIQKWLGRYKNKARIRA